MKHSLKITLFLIGLFIVSQYVGIAILSSYLSVDENGDQQFDALPFDVERPQTEGISSSIFIIAAVLIGTVLALLILKYKLFLFWKVWLLLAVWTSMTFAFAGMFNEQLAILCAAVLAVWKIFKPNVVVHNLTELFIYAGIAAMLVPIMNMSAAFVMLVAISLYDFWAVFHSKHMVTLAQSQQEAQVFSGLHIEYERDEHKSSHAKKNTKQKKAGKVTANTAKINKTLAKTTHASGEKQSAILGGGDIAFALLFTGVVLKEFGLLASLIIPVFTTASLAYLLLSSKKNKFYPAMPFISVGCLVGYLIVLMI